MEDSAVLSLMLIASCLVLTGQQRKASTVSKASIDISGVKLHLGMTKADVAEKLAGKAEGGGC